MKVIWVAIVLVATVTFGAPVNKKMAESDRNNPILVKFRTSYKHVYEGIKSDIPYYDRMRKRMKDTLGKAKTPKTRQAAKDVIGIFDQLIESEQTLLDFFEGTKRQVDMEGAMKKVVELEQRLRSVVTVKRRRSWLTFDEYQYYLKRGWRPQSTGDPRVLPFARELWKPPKKEP